MELIDIETELLREYKEFMFEHSRFLNNDRSILPSTPQSFSVFPTIVFSETSNVDYLLGKSTDRTETVDNLLYQVDIYTKDIKKDGKTYAGRTVINELKNLTFKFFNDIGFIRENATRGEYIDATVSRYIIVESGKINNWNGKISQ